MMSLMTGNSNSKFQVISQQGGPTIVDKDGGACRVGKRSVSHSSALEFFRALPQCNNVLEGGEREAG